MKKFILLGCFGLIISCALSPLSKEPTKKIAIGSSKIFDDKELAKKNAINNALHQLIKQHIVNSEDSNISKNDYALVEPFIDAETSGMIHEWQLIDEKQQDGFYFVKIKGKVNISESIKIVKAARNKKGKPSCVVLVHEKINGKSSELLKSASNALIIEHLKKSGFKVIDLTVTGTLSEIDRKSIDLYLAGSIPPQEQSSVLSGLGADVIIAGTVDLVDQTAVLKEYNTKMKSMRAIINLRAVDAGSGQILVAASTSGAGVHIKYELAVRKAIETSLDSPLLFASQGERVRDNFPNGIEAKYISAIIGKSIEIYLTGLNAEQTLLFRKNLLQQVQGVNRIFDVNGFDGGLKMRVHYPGKALDLAEQIKTSSSKMGCIIDSIGVKSGIIYIKARPL